MKQYNINNYTKCHATWGQCGGEWGMVSQCVWADKKGCIHTCILMNTM